MMRFAPEGGDGEIVARGLRSSVGFAWNANAQSFATNMPRTASGLDPEVTLSQLSPEKRARLSEIGGDIFKSNQCERCHENKPGNKILKDIGQHYDLVSLGQLLQKPPPPIPLLPFTDDDRRALSVYLIETY